jgi:hypothetical protein
MVYLSHDGIFFAQLYYNCTIYVGFWAPAWRIHFWVCSIFMTVHVIFAHCVSNSSCQMSTPFSIPTAITAAVPYEPVSVRGGS